MPGSPRWRQALEQRLGQHSVLCRQTINTAMPKNMPNEGITVYLGHRRVLIFIALFLQRQNM